MRKYLNFSLICRIYRSEEVLIKRLEQQEARQNGEDSKEEEKKQGDPKNKE